MIMCWSLLINGMDYLIYEFDWNSFGIPINLMNNGLLYSNDLLANQEFPHYWIYKLVSIFVESYFVNVIFFIGFVFQNILLLKSFEILYKKYDDNNLKSLTSLVIFSPLFFYPQISGHFTSLPFFLPSILGFSLAIYNLTNFIFVEKRKIEDYFFIFLLIFVHPFWSIFVTLYLFLIYIFTKGIGKDKIIPLTGVLVVSYLLNSFDGISFFQIYGSELVEFYKSYIKIHFNWSEHVGKLFKYSLNNYYQHSLLVIFLIGIVFKKNFFNFYSLENTFFTSFGLIVLLIILGNVFYDSPFNNLLIASNFYRIGSLSWFFIGLFVYRVFEGNISGISLLIVPFLFYIASSNEVFNKQIDLIPFIKFSSNFTYLLFIFGIYFLYKNKKRYSFLAILFGKIYYFLFYFIDKSIFDQYLLTSSIIILFTLSIALIIIKKINISYNFLISSLIALFLITSFDISPLIKQTKLIYEQQISEEQVSLIQQSTDKNSVILIEPTISHFRKETKRGILIDYSLIPYNVVNYENYQYYKSLFNSKSLMELSDKEIINIIRNTNVTDLLLPVGSLSEEYFKDNYDFVSLGSLGSLILDVEY